MHLPWPLPGPNPLSSSLVDVWETWRRSLRGRRCWSRWALLTSIPADFTGDTSPGGTMTWNDLDHLQASLVWLVQNDQPTRTEATYTLVVLLRPGLLRLARDRSRASGAPFEPAVHETVATFVEVLLTHNLGRRPTKIAANVLLDTRQLMVRSERRSSRSHIGSEPSVPDTPSPLTHGVPSHATPDTSTVSLRAALASELAELPGVEHHRRQTATIVYRAWFMDQSQSDIAKEVGISPAAVAARLCRVRRRLRVRLNTA